MYDLVVNEFGGSFSAEHGVGPYNEGYFRRDTDPSTLALGAALHKHFDPHGQLGNVRLD